MLYQDFMTIITTPPGSMFFILIMSVIVAVISTGLTKLLVDTDELNRKQVLIKAHQEEKAKIIELAEIDADRYHKARKRWERKDVMLKQTQQRMALQRLKPTCVTCVPMIVIFGIIRVWFLNAPVALTAMNAWDVPLLGDFIHAFTIDPATGAQTDSSWTAMFYGHQVGVTIDMGWINFTTWYFLCSLGINTLLQRILGIQTQATGGMESMFSGQKASAQQFPEI